MNTYERVLTALADPTRRRIVELLREGPLPAGRIAEHFPVSRPAISQHLRVLREAGLVEVRAEGTTRRYAAAPAGLEPLRAYLDGFWGEVLGAFRAAVEQRQGGKDDV